MCAAWQALHGGGAWHGARRYRSEWTLEGCCLSPEPLSDYIEKNLTARAPFEVRAKSAVLRLARPRFAPRVGRASARDALPPSQSRGSEGGRLGLASTEGAPNAGPT